MSKFLNFISVFSSVKWSTHFRKLRSGWMRKLFWSACTQAALFPLCLTSEPKLFLPRQGLVLWSIESTSTTVQNSSAHCKSPVKVNEDSSLRFSLSGIPHGSASVEKQASKDTEFGSTQKIIPLLENCLTMEWAACPRRCLHQRWLLSELYRVGQNHYPRGREHWARQAPGCICDSTPDTGEDISIKGCFLPGSLRDVTLVISYSLTLTEKHERYEIEAVKNGCACVWVNVRC